MRYALNDRFTIKNGTVDEFHRLMDAEVLPLLRNTKGFRDDLTIVVENSCMNISVWNDRASAETYKDKTHPEVLEKLCAVLAVTSGPVRGAASRHLSPLTTTDHTHLSDREMAGSVRSHDKERFNSSTGTPASRRMRRTIGSGEKGFPPWKRA